MSFFPACELGKELQGPLQLWPLLSLTSHDSPQPVLRQPKAVPGNSCHFTHRHTHTDRHTDTHTHRHRHTQTHTVTHSHTQSHTHTHARTHTHTRTHARTHARTLTVEYYSTIKRKETMPFAATQTDPEISYEAK